MFWRLKLVSSFFDKSRLAVGAAAISKQKQKIRASLKGPFAFRTRKTWKKQTKNVKNNCYEVTKLFRIINRNPYWSNYPILGSIFWSWKQLNIRIRSIKIPKFQQFFNESVNEFSIQLLVGYYTIYYASILIIWFLFQNLLSIPWLWRSRLLRWDQNRKRFSSFIN